MVVNNFQRKGSSSNAQVGNDFEEKVISFFTSQGIILRKSVVVDIGINDYKKPHKYDLGNPSERIIIECKSHTWTSSDNVPSAKITTWDQAMFYFHATPNSYRKIFVVLKDLSLKRKETLCDYYLRRKRHLIPDDVEIWEYDEISHSAICKKR